MFGTKDVENGSFTEYTEMSDKSLLRRQNEGSIALPEPLVPSTKVSNRCRKTIILLVILAVAVGIIALCVALPAWLVVVPGIAQHNVNQATLRFEKATMYAPVGDTLMLDASLILNNVGMFAADLDKAELTFSDSNGNSFATTSLPAISMAGSEAKQLELSMKLTVHNNQVFIDATAPVLQGKSGMWHMDAHPAMQVPLGPVTKHTNVHLSKDLQLPSTALENMVAKDLQVTSTSNSEIMANITVSFFSSSTLQISHLGPTDFSLHPVSHPSVTLGMAHLDDFSIIRGMNTLTASVHITRTAENDGHINDFLTQWSMGNAQMIKMLGPVNNSSPYLNGLTEQVITMVGLDKPLVTFAFGDESTVASGVDKETGEACTLTDGHDCLRGANVVLNNPMLHVPLKVSDLKADTRLSEGELNYDVTLGLLAGLAQINSTCTGGDGWMSRMYTTPGMYAGLDLSLKKKDWVDVPAGRSTGFFLPIGPIPGVPMLNQNPCVTLGDDPAAFDPFGCCLTTVWTAAACKYYNQPETKGQPFIPIDMVNTNMTLHVGDYEAHMTGFEQRNMLVAMNEQVRNFDFHDQTPARGQYLTFDCSSIRFH